MATSKKVTELPAITTASSNDVLYIVHDPAGVPVSNKITVQDLAKSVNTAAFNAVNTDIIPSITNTFSLGSPSHQWKNIYVGNSATSAIYIGDVAITVDASGTLVVNGSIVAAGGVDGINAYTGSILHAGYGNIFEFGNSSVQTIVSMAKADASEPNAQRLVIQGQPGYGAGEGGDIYLWAGESGIEGGSGGDIKVDAGYGHGSQGGTIKIRSGNSDIYEGGFLELHAGSGNTGANITFTTYTGTHGGSGQHWWTMSSNGYFILPDGAEISSDQYNVYLKPSSSYSNILGITPTGDHDIHLYESHGGGAITLGAYGATNLRVYGAGGNDLAGTYGNDIRAELYGNSTFNITTEYGNWQFTNTAQIVSRGLPLWGLAENSIAEIQSRATGTNFDNLANDAPVDSYIYAAYNDGVWLGSGTKADNYKEWYFSPSGTTYVPGKISNSAWYPDNAALTLSVNDFGSRAWFARTGDLGINGIDEGASSLVHDSSGNVYVLGTVNSSPGDVYAVLIKYDRNGSIIWQKSYSNSSDFRVVSGTSLFISSDNHIYMSCSSYSQNIIYILKLDMNGDLIWNKSIESTGYARLYDMAGDDVGNLYLGGEIETYDGIDYRNKAWLVKLDITTDTPSVIWNKTLDDAAFVGIWSFYITSMVCVGTDLYVVNGPGVSKIDSTGNIVWQWLIDDVPTVSIYGFSIAYNSYAGLLVVSGTRNNEPFVMTLIPSDGSRQNVAQYNYDNGGGMDAISVETDPSDGSIYSLFVAYDVSSTQQDQGHDSIILVKYDSVLNLQWQRSLSSQKGEQNIWWDGHHAISLHDGFVAVCGYGRSMPLTSAQGNAWDMLTIQVPIDGSLSNNTYDGLFYGEPEYPIGSTIYGPLIAVATSLADETTTTFGPINIAQGNSDLLNFRSSLTLKELILENTGNVRLPINGDLIDHDGTSPLRDVPQRKVLIGDYTLELSDRGKHVLMDISGTVYVPNLGTWPLGTTIMIVSTDGNVGIIGSGQDIRSNGTGNYNEAYWIPPWTMASLLYTGAGQWILSAPVINTNW